ncbi:hypothetical protein [Desulfofalx alkaliphila]|uniref:hypothetical protein n=1 Tax=Desulfofalx alkaliphila TaxID=105483 RepID=UPI0004E1DA13|nr:hypothetical protein [Desulfofalx alkaliphila]
MKITKYYVNTSTEYQIVGSCREVVFAGTKRNCLVFLDGYNVVDSPYGVVELVAPGDKISSTYAPQKPIKIGVEEGRDLAAELFGEARKPYCTQNNGDCSTCSLANYNRDCQNNLI